MNRREVLASVVGAAAVLPAIGSFAAPAMLQQSSGFGATLHIGPAQAGSGNHRWAHILGGEVPAGSVLAGRMDWQVDPASGAALVSIICSIRNGIGRTVKLHRTDLQAVRLPDGLVRLSAANAA